MGKDRIETDTKNAVEARRVLDTQRPNVQNSLADQGPHEKLMGKMKTFIYRY